MKRWLVLLLGLSGCVFLREIAKPPHALDDVVTQFGLPLATPREPINYCYTTTYGTVVYTMDRLDCPKQEWVEADAAAVLRVANANPALLSFSHLYWVRGPVFCAGMYVDGCTKRGSGAMMVSANGAGFPDERADQIMQIYSPYQTLRHEYGHVLTNRDCRASMADQALFEKFERAR